MRRVTVLIAFLAFLIVSCQPGKLQTPLVAEESVASNVVANLICGSQIDCLPKICNDAKRCPLMIALSDEAIFDFVKTYSACDGCEIQEFSSDNGIGKCIEYEINEDKQGWTVELWVSGNCTFRYSNPTLTRISVSIDAETQSIYNITPAVEYIKDPSYCKIDSDCKCLSGSGVPFVGCSNFFHAPLNWTGFYPGDDCACIANQCKEK